MLGGRGPFQTTLTRNGLSHFADEEGLQIRIRTGPLQTDNGMSGLAGDKIALSVGAGHFRFAGLAL
jgi:hypothetical protein